MPSCQTVNMPYDVSSPKPNVVHTQMKAIYPMDGIETPHKNDVVCGRGKMANEHIGNLNYRRLVHLCKEQYDRSPKRLKLIVSKSIVGSIRSQNPPGRFLEKDPETGLWFDVGDKRAAAKTSQTLREDPESRRYKDLDKKYKGKAERAREKKRAAAISLLSLGTEDSRETKVTVKDPFMIKDSTAFSMQESVPTSMQESAASSTEDSAVSSTEVSAVSSTENSAVSSTENSGAQWNRYYSAPLIRDSAAPSAPDPTVFVSPPTSSATILPTSTSKISPESVKARTEKKSPVAVVPDMKLLSDDAIMSIAASSLQEMRTRIQRKFKDEKTVCTFQWEGDSAVR